ncbi:GtrA family protein [Puniceicoccaceae bacterium K14]|nr:GtrA family protein [Puniceicoccaceae bacterium K14]
MSKSNQTAGQILRFLIVSGISFTIDLSLYSGLTLLADLDSSWAKRISFGCVFFWSFFAHKRFTFRQRKIFGAEPLKFTLVYALGWLLNSSVHDLTAQQADPSAIAFIAATISWALLNFVGQKWFVFANSQGIKSATSN